MEWEKVLRLHVRLNPNDWPWREWVLGRLRIKESLPGGRSLHFIICSCLSWFEVSMNWLIFRDKQASRKLSLLLLLWWLQRTWQEDLDQFKSKEAIFALGHDKRCHIWKHRYSSWSFITKDHHSRKWGCNREVSRWRHWPQETKGVRWKLDKLVLGYQREILQDFKPSDVRLRMVEGMKGNLLTSGEVQSQADPPLVPRCHSRSMRKHCRFRDLQHWTVPLLL